MQETNKQLSNSSSFHLSPIAQLRKIYTMQENEKRNEGNEKEKNLLSNEKTVEKVNQEQNNQNKSRNNEESMVISKKAM